MAYNQLVGGPKSSSEFTGVIAGFDSFDGLPEKWRGSFDQGAFATQYEKVRNSIPESVELYRGWFQDTIIDFKTNHADVPAAVIHHCYWSYNPMKTASILMEYRWVDLDS